jgi:seryl-tRNA synthetase
MLDLHTREHGYTEVLPPYLVNSESMYGTGQLPKFAADSFRVPHGDKDLWLIPTAEVPVTNLYRDEVLDAARLPISLTAYTPCFPQRGGIVRERCARHHPAASVSESGAGEIFASGKFL